MPTQNTATSMVDFNDVQALLRFGFKHHTEGCFLLLRVKEPAAARAWLADAPVTSAVTVSTPAETVMQIAFTAAGLHALGVARDVVTAFSAEFVTGLTDASRSRRLGDVGANDPSRWAWGGPQDLPHVLVLLYALPGRLEEWRGRVTEQCAAGFDVQQSLATTDLRGFEPFGFADGLAQPQLDWQRTRPVRDADLIKYTNLACLGEFVLGYPNEYGRYTDRPLIDPSGDSAAMLPRAEDEPRAADLGRNGSYLVLRQLRQDVRGFWKFMDAQAAGDSAARQRLAEAMVGRRMSGEPLVELSAGPIDGVGPDQEEIGKNAFTYDADPDGVRCPFGAHIRRSNPRNADLPQGVTGVFSRLIRILGFDRAALRQDLVASTRFHRILRRGRAYGATLPTAQVLAGKPGALDTGLYFMCLNANIARQFEFVQGAWQMGTKFNGLSGESDPLLGNRCPVAGNATPDVFSIPQTSGPDRRVTGLPQFVTVVGGAYFFLPGIRALRYLALARS